MPDHTPPMYVGYLETPARHRAFLKTLVPVLMLALIATPALIAASHRDPGAAVWDVASERSWTGTVVMDPYPMLVEPDGTGWLVVGMGKFAVHERLESFSRRVCTLRGYRLNRGDRRMIELLPGDGAITSVSDAAPSLPEPGHGPREITLVTEIVDGKCHLGAMKPGDGVTHRSCAILCIRGGLPPLLDAKIPGIDGTLPLLLVDGSMMPPPSVLAMIGEPVEIRGELTMRHGIPVLSARRDDIRRAP